MANSNRKTDARNFHAIHDILQSLSLAQYHLKGQNASISHSGNREVKIIYTTYDGTQRNLYSKKPSYHTRGTFPVLYLLSFC